MRFSYRLERMRGQVVAQCVEADVAGEGPTSTDALRSLRTALEERMFRPDAVAPPSREGPRDLELVPAETKPRRSLDLGLGGPGEPPVTRR